MGYTLCMANDCSNLTTDELSEYGTYCFNHSNLTYEPQKNLVKSPKMYNQLTSVSFSLGNMDKPFESIQAIKSSSTHKKVKSQIRKIPSLVNENKYDNMECCVCDTSYSISDKMDCGHLLCEECLEHIRSLKCPLCKAVISGPLLTEETVEEIEKRYREDIEERGAEDETMAYLASLGYNPNDLY